MAAGPHLAPQAIGGPGPGSYLLVKYDLPDTTWHSRLLLAHLNAGEWIVLTPDGDIYSEEYSPSNGDIASWRPYDPQVGAPFGVAVGDIYDFHPRPDQATVARLLTEGQAHAHLERMRLGLPAPGGQPGHQMAPAAPAAGSCGGAGPQVAALAGGGADVNAAPNPAGPAAALAALAGVSNAAGVAAQARDAPMDQGDDARTLSISRDGEGARFKEFRSAVQECKSVDFQDWPVSGPRTVKHVITQMINNGGSALGHHQQWRVACKMQPTDGPAQEHESWSRVLDAMLCYDQLDVTNLAAAELVVRSIQRLEEKHNHKMVSTDDAGESALFMGAAAGARAGLVISPKLTEWIGAEMQKEALVAKERRKAREERALSRKNDKKEESGK